MELQSSTLRRQFWLSYLIYDPKLIERSSQGLKHEFKAVESTNGSQDMCRIAALLASCLDPATGLTSIEKGIEELLSLLMTHESFAKIMQQREVKAGITQLQT